MDVLERKGESKRTAPRRPAGAADLAAYRDHFDALASFTATLAENRCRRTNHFDERLGETVAAFRPLFAPWNMELVFLLYMQEPCRFNGLKRTLEGVSSRVLTDKLRHLTDAGLVERREVADRHVEYGLTEHGRVVARHLHPLLFYLQNRPELTEAEAPRPRAPPE